MVLSQRRTYYKRQRGILKKCIELSQKCKQDVYLVIFDRNSRKFVEFSSSDNFDLTAVYNER